MPAPRYVFYTANIWREAVDVMRLRRIAITDFRCFADQTVEIDDIGNGITLIAGDNEEGKSTVLAALQAVLFEKHTVGGEAARDMLPFGAKVQPRVALDFEIGETSYQLEKAFCQKPEARLRSSEGERWTGDDAEDALRRLLDFTPAARGAAKPENRGLQALLWVEQGAAFDQPPVTGSVHARIAAALEAEVGAVTGGDRGRSLIKRVEKRLSSLVTSAIRRPTGAYKDAIAREDAARQRADELAVELRSLESKTDDLERAREQLSRLEADNPIEAADRRLAEARATVIAVESLEKDLQAARADLGMASAQRELAQSNAARRKEDREGVAQSGIEATKAGRDEAVAVERHDSAMQNVATAATAHETAKETLVRARMDAETWKRVAGYLEKRRRLEADRSRLERALAADEQAMGHRGRAKAETVTEDVVDRIRTQEAARRERQARLGAAATAVSFMPDGTQKVVINGDPVPSPKPVTLVKKTRVELEGYGAIEVTPGGEDLDERRAAADHADEDLRAELSEHGVTSMADAEARLKARNRALADAEKLDATVLAQAPEGLETLKETVASLTGELEDLEKSLAGANGLSATVGEAQAEAARAADDLTSKSEAERRASDELTEAEAAVRSAKKALEEAKGRREDQAAKAADAEKRLAAEAALNRQSDADLDARVSETAAMEEHAAKKVSDLEARLKAGDPEGARTELGAAEKARAQVEKNLQRLRGDVRELAGEVRALGGNDTVAEKEIADGELARAAAQRARLEFEAEAVTLLLDTLTDEERQARETFLGPIRERMLPYLQRLFPGTELVLDDESLKISHLRRDGQDEPYHKLSIGTREQLAVLTRLAFAELLGEQGTPSPIVLDDALVYSDDRRFEEMQRILDRAAASQQILVLTCHERAYFDRGWETKRLGAGR